MGSDVLLFPALLFQVPSEFAPFFSPVGFSWCSRTHSMRNEVYPLNAALSTTLQNMLLYAIFSVGCSAR